jgi:uncharacterized iron-regulated membrane protein
MRLNILNRRVHYWLSIVIALPFLVVLATGLLLQLKKQLTWVQPAEQRGSGKIPAVSFDQILEACRSVPEAGIESWDDIDRLDVRPGKGMLKVQGKNCWEIQLDAQTAKVLQVAYRRSDLIEAIHDGSWFHDYAKLGVFLPVAVLLLLMWVTGIYLFWLPIVVKRRRRRAASVEQTPTAVS